jgi:hypothetical protein
VYQGTHPHSDFRFFIQLLIVDRMTSKSFNKQVLATTTLPSSSIGLPSTGEHQQVFNSSLLSKTTNLNLKYVRDFIDNLIVFSGSHSNASNSEKINEQQQLTSFRSVCMFYSIHYFNFSVVEDIPFVYSLILKMKALSTSENDSDRKTFRILCFLLGDILLYSSENLFSSVFSSSSSSRPTSSSSSSSPSASFTAAVATPSLTSEQKTVIIAIKELFLFLLFELNYSTSPTAAINGNSSENVSRMISAKKFHLIRLFGNLTKFCLRNPLLLKPLESELMASSAVCASSSIPVSDSSPVLSMVKQAEEMTKMILVGIQDAIALYSLSSSSTSASLHTVTEKRDLLAAYLSSFRRTASLSSSGYLNPKTISIPLLGTLANTGTKALSLFRNLFSSIDHSIACLSYRSSGSGSGSGNRDSSDVRSSSLLKEHVDGYGEIILSFLKSRSGASPSSSSSTGGKTGGLLGGGGKSHEASAADPFKVIFLDSMTVMLLFKIIGRILSFSLRQVREATAASVLSRTTEPLKLSICAQRTVVEILNVMPKGR